MKGRTIVVETRVSILQIANLIAELEAQNIEVNTIGGALRLILESIQVHQRFTDEELAKEYLHALKLKVLRKTAKAPKIKLDELPTIDELVEILK